MSLRSFVGACSRGGGGRTHFWASISNEGRLFTLIDSNRRSIIPVPHFSGMGFIGSEFSDIIPIGGGLSERMIKQSRAFLWFLFLVFPCFSQGKEETRPVVVKKDAILKTGEPLSASPVVSSTNERVRSLMNTVLGRYQNNNIQLKVEKTFRIPVIDKVSREKGSLHLQRGGRFRYFTRSSTSSGQLMIFDGEHLWYQPDIKEKTVFQLSSHSQWHLFSGLFDPERFFQVFKVEKFEETAGNYIIHLKPGKSAADIQRVILNVRHYIRKVRVLWNDMNNWQEYTFSSPWVKKQFLKSLFVFNTEGFEVISKIQKKKVPGKM